MKTYALSRSLLLVAFASATSLAAQAPLLGIRLEANARSSIQQLVISGGQPGSPACVLIGAAGEAVPGPLGTSLHVRPDVVVPLGSFDAAGTVSMPVEHLASALGAHGVGLQAASLGRASAPLWLSAGLEAGQVGASPPAPGEWCWAHQRYVASLAGGSGNVLGLCPELGPCDNPLSRNAAIPTAATPIKTYRLSIHVFRDDDGSNGIATLADVAAAVSRLNLNCAQWRIQFVYEANFINSTQYRVLASSEEFGMKKAYAVSPTTKLNVYVVDTGGGCWGTFPWDARALGSQGGIVMNGIAFVATNPALLGILTHEVGHCLGLWHTFHGVTEVVQCSDCYEPAGRTAAVGDVTGDLCSDTNPTTNTNVCSDPAGLDPCSSSAWSSAPYLNYMGYSNSCAVQFTPEQAGRMHCWSASVLSGWLDVPAPPAAPGTPSLTKIGGGLIAIAWADNSTNENGFLVERATKSGGTWINTQIIATVGIDITSATDAPGVGTFRYRVQAFNGIGGSVWSGWRQIKN